MEAIQELDRTHQIGYLRFVLKVCWPLSVQDNISYQSFVQHELRGLEQGSWCLTLLPTIFQLYFGNQFYWWRTPSIRRKPPTCCKSLTNFITLCRVHHAILGFELTTGTDCTGSWKSNYHTITSTTALHELSKGIVTIIKT